MQNNLSDLQSLLERLKGATGPDEELGLRVVATLLSKEPIAAFERSKFNGVWCAYTEGFDGKRRLWDKPSPFRQMPDVTESIDAALALVERVAPHMCVENFGEMRDSGELTGHWLAQLGPRGPRKRLAEISAEGLRATLDAFPLESAPTPTLALLTALLQALIASKSPSEPET